MEISASVGVITAAAMVALVLLEHRVARGGKACTARQTLCVIVPPIRNSVETGASPRMLSAATRMPKLVDIIAFHNLLLAAPTAAPVGQAHTAARASMSCTAPSPVHV